MKICIKNLLICMSMFCLFIALGFGSIKANAAVKFTKDGDVLTISGNGKINDARDHMDGIKTVIIQEGVTSIEGAAFSYCESLKSINIPSTVTLIDDWAFSDCTSLEHIEFSNGLKKIGTYAFMGCNKLTSIELPDSCTAIDVSAFYSCPNLKKVVLPSNLKTLGECAFMDCFSLENITIPNGVTKISGSAFMKCTSLKSVSIPSNVTAIDYLAFFGCEKLESISIPSKVTSIGFEAFSGCKSLKKISLPANVKTIDYSAFANCDSLTSFEVASGNKYFTASGKVLYSKDKKVLVACSSNTQGALTIPNSVTSIADGAFEGCSKITSVKFHDQITSIGRGAFKNCKGLSTVSLPKAVKVISYSAFEGCSGLETVTLPSGLTTIESSAFSECSKLIYVNIPKGVKEIGFGAFENCKNLVSVSIPNSCTSIAPKAFYYCDSLDVISIPSSVTDFGWSIVSYDTTILCEANSDARAHAYVNNHKFEIVDLDYDISKCTISINQPSFGYTGDYIKPVVTVKSNINGKTVTLTNWKDYKVTYKNFKDAGTATIVVTGRGKYVGVNAITFTIRPVNLTNCTATISQPSFAYTGDYIKPIVTVKGNVGGKTVTLTNWKDYKVTYKNFKNPGQASITITGRGGYSFTKTLTFNIRPAQVKNVKYVSKSTSYASLKWDSCVGVTGYEVYRATSKNGTYTKVSTLSATSFKNTGLKSGKTYYYKVRAYKTVGSSKLYGAFSNVYSITTK